MSYKRKNEASKCGDDTGAGSRRKTARRRAKLAARVLGDKMLADGDDGRPPSPTNPRAYHHVAVSPARNLGDVGV